MHKLIKRQQEILSIIQKNKQTSNKIIKEILVLMLSYIQPFEDGNKRTARITANAILLAHDYCLLSYSSVDETEYKKAMVLFYEQNSALYFKELFLNQYKQAINNYFQ